MAEFHNSQGQVHTARSLSAKAFLFRSYIGLFLGAIVFSFLIAAFLAGYQVRALNNLYIDRGKKVVRLHRNELLNEIVLGDFISLSQHLQYLLNETNADKIKLTYEGREWTAESPGKHTPSILTSLISGLGAAHPFQIDIADDFGSFRAVLEVTYTQALCAGAISPLVISLLFIIVAGWGSMAFMFFALYRRVRRSFLDPLNAVTASLLQHTALDTTEAGEGKLRVKEIAQLAHACAEFQAVEKEAALARIARQVSHDIRSPLAVLDTLLKLVQELPEEQRVLLRTASGRIRDIANNLLSQTRPAQGMPTENQAPSARPEWLYGLVDAVLSEKRHQYRSRKGLELLCEFTTVAYPLCVDVEAGRFKRVLSNLLDNAVEAIPDAGRIEIMFVPVQHHVEVVISDNGRGIPADILPKLMNRGQSYEKPGGSGLGLAFACESLERWGGKIRISSLVGTGTSVWMRLPLASQPPWFVATVQLPPQGRVVIVDDDPGIHQVWEERLRGLTDSAALPERIHLSTLDELRRWHAEHQSDGISTLYLCDYEFKGTAEHGLQCIVALGIAHHTILVTGRAEESSMQEQCISAALKLLPKNAAPVVPLIFASDDAHGRGGIGGSPFSMRMGV